MLPVGAKEDNTDYGPIKLNSNYISDVWSKITQLITTQRSKLKSSKRESLSALTTKLQQPDFFRILFEAATVFDFLKLADG